MIVHGMMICSSFQIGVCMFIMSKALLISSATVIVRAEGAIWLIPFAMVLFSVCSAVTVVLCFVPVLRGCVCCWYQDTYPRTYTHLTIPPDIYPPSKKYMIYLIIRFR